MTRTVCKLPLSETTVDENYSRKKVTFSPDDENEIPATTMINEYLYN
jgi:hypothetical protein